MDVETAIRKRRSIKQFDATHRMTDEEIDKLLDLAALSPTAFNIQHWRFVVARDPVVRTQLRLVAYDQAQITDASLLIAICADVKAWDRDPARYWRNLPSGEAARTVAALRRFYAPAPELQRDEAMRSAGIAAMTLMLAATAVGYGSCPMDGFDFAAVARILQLPADHIVCLFVAIGRTLEEPGPRPGSLAREEVVVEDRFPARAPRLTRT